MKPHQTNPKPLGTLAAIAALLFAFCAPQSVQAQIYINPLTCGSPNATLYLGDYLNYNASPWYVNFEIGQQSWNNAQVGVGPNLTGSGYTWFTAFYYQDGTYPNKDVRADVSSIQFTSTGNWGVICQARANPGDTYTSESACGWGNPTVYPPASMSSYFTVNALAAPTSPTATRSDSALQVALGWTASTSGGGTKSTLILRNTSNSFTAPTQGTPYSVGNAIGGATVVYNGSGGSATDTTSLSGGTTYYYSFYAVNNNYYSAAAGTVPSATTRPTTATWNGAGGNNNLQTDANWSGGSYPVPSAVTILNFAGSTQTSPSNNFTAGSTFSNIFFNVGAAAFTLGGNQFNIQDKIENDSSSLATITNSVTWAASSGSTWGEINASSNNLVFSTGILTVNGSSINGIKMWGGNGDNVTFSNTVSASGKWFGLTSVYTQSATISGSFTSGDFYVMNGGTLNLSGSGSLSTTGLRLGGDYSNTGNQNQTLGGAFNLTSTTGGQTYSGIINSVAGNTSGSLVVYSANTSGTNVINGASYLDSGLIVSNALGGTLLANATTAFDVKGQQLTFTPYGTIMVQGILTSSTSSSTVAGGTLLMNGPGTLLLSNTANAYSGTSGVDLNANSTLITGGGTLGIYGDGSLGVTPNGAYNNIQFTGSGTLQDTFNNITLNANRSISIADSQTATLDSSTNTFTIPGVINGSGAVAKVGTGTTTLSGANTYSGGTTIKAGTLALSGSGLITNTASIVVASNAIFNVSGLSSAFTLASALSSQTLSNSAPGAIINGTNNCSAGTISLLYDGVNPSFNLTNGGMRLSASTTFKVNNTGAALGAGSYLIISNVTSGTVGLVAGTAPSVTLSGNTFANTTAGLSINSSGLNLVIKTNQTITFGSGTSLTKTYGNAVFADTATASSGLTVTTYSSDNTAVATVDSNGNVTIVGAGSCNILANQSGNGTYNAAPQVSQHLTVNKASPTVTVNVGSYTYNGSAQGPNSIAPISPADSGAVTWSYAGSGSTTYTASSTPPTAAGTYTATATVAADSNNNQESSSATPFTIGKATPTVTVTPYNVTYDGSAHTASYGTISGVNGETGATVGTIDVSGTTHTSASTYASDSWSLTGTANYNNIAPTTITDTINKATPMVTVNVGSYTYNGSAQGPNSIATISPADSGAVTWSYVGTGNTTYTASSTQPTAAGSYTATASVAADSNNNGASSSATAFTINPAITTITLGTVTEFLYDGAAQTPTNIISSGSTGAWSTNYVGTGSTVYSSVNAPTNAGSYALTNAVASDNNWIGATNGLQFTIGVTNVTITAQPNTKSYDGTASAAAVPTVTAGSLQTGDTATLTEAYTTTDAGTGLALIPTVVSITNAAGADVTADYNVTLANSTAGEIDQVASTTVVTINGGPFTYSGVAHTPATVTVTGVGLSLTPAANYVNNINAGTATASYSYGGDINHTGSSDSQNFMIGQANATFTVTPYTVTYDGNPHTAAVTSITGVNGETGATVGTITVSGTTHTAAGTYASDSWSFTGTANYSSIGSTTITDMISQAGTSVGVSSSENPSGYQDSVFFTATLPTDTANSATVNFLTNGVLFDTETLTLGTATSAPTTLLPRGTNVVTIQFAGDDNYVGSTNDLAGGQIVTNHPPVATVLNVLRTAGLSLHIDLTNLATKWADLDGDTISLNGMDIQSTNHINLKALGWTNGVAITTNDANFAYASIGYTNGPNVNDQFTYTISDNYGGTNVGTVNVIVDTSALFGQGSSINFGPSNTVPKVTFYGIPGYTYVVQRTLSLTDNPTNWVDLVTNSLPAGTNNPSITVTDTNNPEAYYRLKWQP